MTFAEVVNHPAHLDAELMVIGGVLYNNEALFELGPLAPEHFQEPTHGRIFDVARGMIAQQRMAEPLAIGKAMTEDKGLESLGGVRFLSDLVDAAPEPKRTAHYAQLVIEAAQRRDLAALGDEIKTAARSGAEQVSDIIGQVEATLLQMQVHARPTTLVTAGHAADKVLAYLDAPAEALHGVRTGLGPLDEELGPLVPGNLVLLMGRPSMGKSAFAECVALNIAEQGYGVIQINGEMSPEEMAQRHLTDLCQRDYGARGPEYRDIRRRRIGMDQRRLLQAARDKLEPLPLMMLKRPGLKLAQLRSIARRQAMAWARKDIKLGAFIIDHVGLVHPDVSARDRYADQTIVSNTLKELADELECPVIGLNQMNRQNESRDDKRPQLSDLRDSGSWEQDADFVIGFYREAYYAQRQAEPKKDLEWGEWDRARKSRTIEAIILKARSGTTMTVKLWGDVARNAIRGEAPEYGDLV